MAEEWRQTIAEFLAPRIKQKSSICGSTEWSWVQKEINKLFYFDGGGGGEGGRRDFRL